MSTNFIVKDDTGVKGRLLPIRSSGYQPQKAPFLSRVASKEQIGLPPVVGNMTIEYKPLKNSKLKRYIKKKDGLLVPLDKFDQMAKTEEHFWNKRINPYLEHLNKDKEEEKAIIEEVDKKEEKKVKEEKPKTPKLESKPIENNIPKPEETLKKLPKDETIQNKENNVKVNTDDLKLDEDEGEEIKKEEMDNILDYINDLDYEKYSKDMELREALQLIKNKMDKDNVDENKKEAEQNPQIEGETTNPKEKQDNVEETPKEEEKKNDLILPPIEDPNELKRQEEIEKYRALEKLSKNEVSILY